MAFCFVWMLFDTEEPISEDYMSVITASFLKFRETDTEQYSGPYPGAMVDEYTQPNHRPPNPYDPFCHISLKLVSLHWLPVKYRIDFKICLFTFKALHGLALSYLTNLLTTKTNGSSLRSSNQCG